MIHRIDRSVVSAILAMFGESTENLTKLELTIEGNTAHLTLTRGFMLSRNGSDKPESDDTVQPVEVGRQA